MPRMSYLQTLEAQGNNDGFQPGKIIHDVLDAGSPRMIKNGWRELWSARRYDLGAFAVLTLFFLIFFQPALFHGKFFVTSDAFIYSYPLRTLVWDQLRQGKLPLWTPHIMSGYPLLSMAQIGVGYPLTWFYALLPGRFAETIYDLAPYLLFPFFIYCYLREVGRSRLASILAALAFGYGGFLISPVAYNGLLGNALLWLPLMLIAIERARTGPFVRCLLLATAANSMSVLTGVGQGIVLAGALAIAYAAFIGLAIELPQKIVADGINSRSHFLSWPRWRPLVVMLSAVVLSAGVAAFQILETMRAQRRSIRSQLSYDLFASGSYKPGGALKAVFLPLYYHLEACGYVAPLALVLAIVALLAAVRNPDRDWRVFFWAGSAACGFLLTLGQNTPVFALLYHVPLFNLFRGAGRHAFELTLAISILAAYGWDAAGAFAARVNSRGNSPPLSKRWRSRRVLLAVSGLGLVLLVGLLWFRDAARIPVGAMEVYYYPPNFGALRYALWKAMFSLLTLIAVWFGWKLQSTRSGVGVLLGVIALACFFEPSIMAARWWWPTLKPAGRFTSASPTTQFLKKYPAEANRVYTYAYPFIEEYSAQPRLEPTNLTILHGLHDVAGYEPLILQRYSRALGDTYVDAVRPRPGYGGDLTLFDSSSHVLDLLNTRFVVSYPYLATEPAVPIEKAGIKFSARDLDKSINPGSAATLKGVAANTDTLALVTSTAFSAGETDGTPVARVRLFSPDGKIIERWLRIGADTAEWAHERPDVRPIVRHSLAPIFDGSPGDAGNTYTKYNFISRQALGERLTVDHIGISNVSKNVVLILNKATLFDSATNFSMPLPHYDLNKWKPVYDDGGATILRNERALPRAWLVAEAEAVDGEEALRRIRGQGEAFDPRRTALLEIQPRNLPALPGGLISPAAFARIVQYENNRLVIETAAEAASVLVVSEINYPGWIATVDGANAPVHTADFLLRGIVLPAGSHRVEMRYTAPGARNGAVISILTILLIGALALYERRRDGSARKRRKENKGPNLVY